MKNNNVERFEQLGTKIDPAMAKVLNAVCDVLKVDVYHMLQWFAYVMIRAASPLHNLDPRVRKLMTLLESEAGWQTAFNQCNPDKLKVSQVVIIMEQEGHKGFGATMVDKPFMSEAKQTECVDDILERLVQVTMPGVYKRLRRMEKQLGTDSLMDTLLTMLDAQEVIEAVEGDRMEGPQLGSQTEGGRHYGYGKKTKAKQHRTPDSVANDQRIKFDDNDRDAAESEVDDGDR